MAKPYSSALLAARPLRVTPDTGPATLTAALRGQASKHAEAYLLIEGYWIPYGCESSGEWSRHACSLPGSGDFEAVGAVVEGAPDDKRSLDGPLVETGVDRFVDVLIDGVNRLDPLAHIERPELIAVGGDAGLWSDRLRVDEQAVKD